MYGLARALLFLLPAETAHRIAGFALRILGRSRAIAARVRRALLPPDPRLRVRVLGAAFDSPVGVAAGFDKGEGLSAGLFALGFGSVEVGTITPRPQAGNPRPRLFRVKPSRALVNRMGFNNAGVEASLARYARRFRPGPLGFNLDKNRDTPPDRAANDYVTAAHALAPLADYLVVNVSSPNTPGLRDLQAPDRLRAIAEPVIEAAAGKPVLLKLAPDLAGEDVDAISDLAVSIGAAGLVLSNTTVTRAGLPDVPAARETGGLSGAPLLERTIELLRRVRARHGARLVLIGAGGLESGEHAYRMIRAGASLVQSYTGFVYRGPTFARDVGRELAACLARDGIPDIAAAVGLDVPLPTADQPSSRTMTSASSPSSE